ncbi:terminase small subunit [Paenibacillus arenosi]|uniref:Terminase small subunit n=1 Tax=Paenibacillus arenosi TaxID=2774142 RepID=A0ABR9B3A4_9BACL|nr:terminase small subunit [Paenibacillus arenosi]
MALTAKQQRYVEEFLIDLDATQVAIRAGYSARQASEMGNQPLHKTTV